MSLVIIIMFLVIILTIIRQKYIISSKTLFYNNLKCEKKDTYEIIENASKQPHIYVDKIDNLQIMRYSFLRRNQYTYNYLNKKSGVEYPEYFKNILSESEMSFWYDPRKVDY
jgi:hypothetical protein